jgi:hypothetical protein
MWGDIAGIVFTSVTMNHLGLIGKIEEVTEKEIPVLDCPKCASFWLTLIYLVLTGEGVVTVFAVSFLASYSALWLELLEAYIDSKYVRLYEKIIKTGNDDTAASDPDGGYSAGSVPDL